MEGFKTFNFYTQRIQAIKYIDEILKSARYKDKDLSVKLILANFPPELFLKKVIMERIEMAIVKKEFILDKDEDTLVPVGNSRLIKETESILKAKPLESTENAENEDI